MTTENTALALLITVVLLALAAMVWGLVRPGRYTPLERFIYAPVYLLSRVLWRVDIEWVDATVVGDEPSSSNGMLAPTLPSTDGSGIGSRSDRERLLTDRLQGGAILVANHRCSIDPFFVQLIAGRRVHWMVAGEYFKAPLLGNLLRTYEAIPTNRGGVDTNAIKRAIALAASGRFVGMFPEGRINRTAAPLLSVRPGAATVALRAGVPIVPLWIEGAPVGPSIFSPMFRSARIRVFVGQPDDWGLKMRQQRERLAELAISGTARGIDETIVAEIPIGLNEPLASSLDDRSISEAWIHRVMERSLAQSGQASDSVAMAGKNWLREP
jgi:1-acyl-sn-glycerol-3-phosphate acyltransferase